MKYEFRYCGMFLLLKALAGFLSVSGAGIIPKFVCPGDSAQVFQNITFNNCSSVVSLYIYGERYTQIARWSLQNCSRNETLLPDYKDRLFLYGNGTISIHNVHPWDQAKYIVNSQMGDISVKDVVQINVMAAPAIDCRPKILHLRNSLFASLRASSCGKPVATLYWKGFGDVPNTSEPVLKLTPGNQNGTYYACIEGPALTCARNSLDYCSKFTIGENISQPILSETWEFKTAVFIVVGIVLGISFILAIAVILIRKRCRKTISRALKGPVVDRRVSGDARVTFGENEESTGGREVKDRKYDPGSSRLIIRSEDHSGNLHDEHCIPLLHMGQSGPTHDVLAISRALKGPVVDRRASGDARATFGESEERTEGREVKDRKYDTGSSRLIIRSEDHSGNLHEAHCMPRLHMYHPGPTHDENLSGVLTDPLEETHVLWNKDFDSFVMVDILANDDQHQATQVYSDSEHERKKATIDHKPRTNSEKKTEFQKLSDASCSKIYRMNSWCATKQHSPILY